MSKNPQYYCHIQKTDLKLILNNIINLTEGCTCAHTSAVYVAIQEMNRRSCGAAPLIKNCDSLILCSDHRGVKGQTIKHDRIHFPQMCRMHVWMEAKRCSCESVCVSTREGM